MSPLNRNSDLGKLVDEGVCEVVNGIVQTRRPSRVRTEVATPPQSQPVRRRRRWSFLTPFLSALALAAAGTALAAWVTTTSGAHGYASGQFAAAGGEVMPTTTADTGGTQPGPR